MAGFTLEESARRLGHFRWLEMRLFELLGSWVADVEDPDVKLGYVASSRHHGWHAQLLEERLPEVRGAQPGPADGPSLAGLRRPHRRHRQPRRSDRALERTVALYRVIVPHLVTAYTAHLERCTPVADATVIRSLGFIVADEVDDWRAGERLAQSLLVDADAVERAGRLRQRLETVVVSTGGITGV